MKNLLSDSHTDFLTALSESETELGNYDCVNKDDKLCYVDTNVYQDNFRQGKTTL